MRIVESLSVTAFAKFWLILSSLGLQACTTLTVYSGDGSVDIQRIFGFINISPLPKGTPIIVRSNSLGLQSGPLGFMIGVSSTDVAFLPERCQFLLYFDAAVDLKEILSHLPAAKDICVVNFQTEGVK